MYSRFCPKNGKQILIKEEDSCEAGKIDKIEQVRATIGVGPSIQFGI